MLDMIVEARSILKPPIAVLTAVPMFVFFMLITVFLPAEAIVAIIALMIIGMHGTASNMIAVAIGVEKSTAAVRHCLGWNVDVGSCWWRMR